MTYAGQPHSTETRGRIMARDRLAGLVQKWDRNRIIRIKLRAIGVPDRKECRGILSRMTEAQKEKAGEPLEDKPLG